MNLKKNWKRFWTLSSAHEGFTLVELIVVIAILAILAGVAVPAYSGYVKKAERAADEQLLAALNTAFVSACMTNGENNIRRTDVNATLSNGAFEYNAPFKTEFDGFYEGGEFKAFDAIIYNAKTGMFMETSAANYALYNKLREEYGDEIAILMASNLGAMGAETLLTEMGSAVAWADEFGLASMGGTPYWNAVLSYFGLSDSDFAVLGQGVSSFAEIPEEQRSIAVAMALANKNDTDPDAAYQMISNATALYAAQNSAGLTTDNLSAWLGTGKGTDDMQNNATANTLAEAAAIYGLYMAYQGDNYSNDSGNVLDIMTEALTDEEFASWVGTDEGEAELEAYKAAMGIINGAADDADSRESILSGGFDNPELIELLEGLLGN